MSVRVCVLGPSGRMGGAVLAAAAGRSDVAVRAAVDRLDAPGVSSEVAPGVLATADLAAGLARCDVYVDFTAPAATRAAARIARDRQVPAVIGTTGLDPDDERALAELAAVAPIVVAANFSLGVNLVLGLVETAARVLGPEWDAEVVETHHRAKRDAPSGTAIAIARAIAAGHDSDYDVVKRYARASLAGGGDRAVAGGEAARHADVGPRRAGEIGVASVRGGDVVGEHVAFFFGAGERIEIAHRATSRGIFAAGALRAAAWVVGKPPGRYTMLDVLGFSR